MSRLQFFAPLVLFFSLTGCATAFKSTQETVHISSDVGCTHVYVDGVYRGVAPLRVPMNAKHDHVITFKRQGYSTQHFFLGSSVSTDWILIDLFLGSIYAVIVDAMTGAWKTLNTKVVHVPMIPAVRHPCNTSSGCDNY
ncbi:PEGA domain-containing protein [Myxococcota bacterium]|nr:PEGA domain-containing protein [Myxococcota bacterium]MBU1536580.1 PEGA domain-containing protein [Myxococcota bacterium]